MGSYVVRIYRERKGHPSPLLGVVMSVDDETQHPFHTSAELGQILAALEGRSAPKTRRSEQDGVLSGVCLTNHSQATDRAPSGDQTPEIRKASRAQDHR